MKKIIIANWKANPQTLEEAVELFRAEVSEAAKYEDTKTIICPPFIYLEELAKIDSSRLGAQDIFWEKAGPFTGEVPAEMLKNLGVEYVLVGHSDRRYILGETDEIINRKIKAALAEKITPVLLVGERSRGDDKKQIFLEQLSIDLDGLSAAEAEKTLFAYEPVWAISTHESAEADTPENTLDAINIIKEFLLENFKVEEGNLHFLYGGSITEKNVADFLSRPEISGAIIGGASLRKDEFANILKTAGSL